MIDERSRPAVRARVLTAVLALLAAGSLPSCDIVPGRAPAHDRRHAAVRCAPDNGGITLAKG